MKKKIIEEAVVICDRFADALQKRIEGKNCEKNCPKTDSLIKVLNLLAEDIKEVEPECFTCLNRELQRLKAPKCVRRTSFGTVVAIVSLLKMKYIDNSNKKKFFISHSSDDKPIVESFIKEILKIGCGFKDEDIFCTLDPTAIRTGDDFREKIIENMKKCDYVLLFISENYKLKDICNNEMGAAWALEGKRILPFVLPGISFEQMGFLNVVKQGASVTETRKLDELYQELCDNYDIKPDWPAFNKAKEDFLDFVKALIKGKQ